MTRTSLEFMQWWARIGEDEEGWKKVGIGAVFGLCALIPLVGIIGQIALLGWGAWVVRRSYRNDPGLPDIGFDGDLVKALLFVGVKAWVVQMVWIFPCMIVGYILFGIFSFGGGLLGGAVEVQAIAIIFALVGMLLLFVCIFAGVLFSTVAKLRVDLSGDMSDGFAFGEVVSTAKANIGTLLIGTIVISIVGFVLSLVGMLACFIGIFGAVALVQVVSGDIGGQMAQIMAGRGATFNCAMDDTPASTGGQQVSPQVFS